MGGKRDGAGYDRHMCSLKVLHVTPYFEDAWAYGGIPRVVADQSAGLSLEGVVVTVATTDAAGADFRLGRSDSSAWFHPHAPISREGVEVRVFPNFSNRLAYGLQLYLPFGLGAFLRRSATDFDVAHLHGCHNFPGVVAARHFHRAGVPYVVQPNGTAPLIERRILAKRIFDGLFARKLLPDASAVVAVTEVERTQLVAVGIEPAKVEVIGNPIDGGLQPKADGGRTFRSRHGLGPGPVVMYLGQLSPRKRVDLLVRAFGALSVPDSRLVVVGSDMGCRAELERLVEDGGFGDRVLFTGVIEGPERFDALAAADVVVYPSKDEIFGLVPLEALLCGTPVVVSDDCGCGEVVGYTGGGLVVPYGKVESLAAAIEGILLDGEAWSVEVERAQAVVKARFDRVVVCRALEALYQKLSSKG